MGVTHTLVWSREMMRLLRNARRWHLATRVVNAALIVQVFVAWLVGSGSTAAIALTAAAAVVSDAGHRHATQRILGHLGARGC